MGVCSRGLQVGHQTNACEQDCWYRRRSAETAQLTSAGGSYEVTDCCAVLRFISLDLVYMS
jgi:hypothetical protein